MNNGMDFPSQKEKTLTKEDLESEVNVTLKN